MLVLAQILRVPFSARVKEGGPDMIVVRTSTSVYRVPASITQRALTCRVSTDVNVTVDSPGITVSRTRMSARTTLVSINPPVSTLWALTCAFVLPGGLGKTVR